MHVHHVFEEVLSLLPHPHFHESEGHHHPAAAAALALAVAASGCAPSENGYGGAAGGDTIVVVDEETAGGESGPMLPLDFGEAGPSRSRPAARVQWWERPAAPPSRPRPASDFVPHSADSAAAAGAGRAYGSPTGPSVSFGSTSGLGSGSIFGVR